MNILIAIQSFYQGGAEMAAIRLANQLVKQGQKVYFLELEYGYTREKKFLAFLNKEIPVFQPDLHISLRALARINTLMPAFVKPVVRSLYKFFKKKLVWLYIKRQSIHIVNSHNLHTDIFLARIKKPGFMLISTFHGHYELYEKDVYPRNIDYLYQNVFAKLDHVVYTTEKHLNTLKRFQYPLDKTTKIYYGFDYKPAMNEPAAYEKGGTLKICIASRAIPGKGWEELIQAAISVNNSRPESVSLDLIGEGELLESLIGRYSEYGCIHFLAYKPVDQIMLHLQQVHLAALPSYYEAESMPNSIIEYLACGKPVITTDNGAIKEMISYEGEYAGYLIELNKGKVCVEDIETAIMDYVACPEKIVQQSSLAIKAFEKFDIVNCGNSYSHLFNKIVA